MRDLTDELDRTAYGIQPDAKAEVEVGSDLQKVRQGGG